MRFYPTQRTRKKQELAHHWKENISIWKPKRHKYQNTEKDKASRICDCQLSHPQKPHKAQHRDSLVVWSLWNSNKQTVDRYLVSLQTLPTNKNFLGDNTGRTAPCSVLRLQSWQTSGLLNSSLRWPQTDRFTTEGPSIPHKRKKETLQTTGHKAYASQSH